MDHQNHVNFDWNAIQAFLAVAEHGALTRAAEAIGSTQPTISRQIAALEAEIGAALFTRSARGTLLTEAGAALVAPAQQMQKAALALKLAVTHQNQLLEGTVRITAAEMICVYLLPPILLSLRQKYPDIQIEVVANNELDNLLERDADIAVRLVKPQQDALVTRHLGNFKSGGYISREYLALKGLEFTPEHIDRFDWIGYDKNPVIINAARAVGFEMSRNSFALRCDNSAVCWQAVGAGLGIGFGLAVLAERDPRLVKILPDGLVPDKPVWLTATLELRSNPRIRAVYDHLAEGFIELLGGQGDG